MVKMNHKERTIWSGSNSLFTNPVKRILAPEFYKISNYRIYKSKSIVFRLGSKTESMELFRITSVEVDQGPYQKIVGLGAGDIYIYSPGREVVWHSVPFCKSIEDKIWDAVRHAKDAMGLYPA